MPLLAVFRANNDTGDVLAINSSDGLNWSGHWKVPISETSAFCVVHGQIWAAVGKTDGTLQMYNSADGQNWAPGSAAASDCNGYAAMTVWNGGLCLIYQNRVTDGCHLSCVTSADGTNWAAPVPVGVSAWTNFSLCTLNGKLFIAFKTCNGGEICVSSSTDAKTWSATVDTGHWTYGVNDGSTVDFEPNGPTLVAFNGSLWIAYSAANSTYDLLVINSADGVSWSGDIQTGHQGGFGTFAVMNDFLWLSYRSANAQQAVLIIRSINGHSWSTDIQTNQQCSLLTPITAYGQSAEGEHHRRRHHSESSH